MTCDLANFDASVVNSASSRKSTCLSVLISTFVKLLTIDWNLTLFAPISDRISEIIARALSILTIALDELCSEDKFISLKEIKLEEEIKNVKVQLKWGNEKRCIAVHVRHGDRSKLNSHVKVSDYVAALKLLPSVRKVLLVTDDFRVIEVIKTNFPEF